VRLGDVARVERGSADRRAYFRSNGQPNIGLGVVKTSTSNSLDVAHAVRAEAERIQPTLPEGTNIFVAFDSTIFIEASLNRVYRTLVEALLLVLIVIYLFLGSLRAALIPAVTVPICLVAAFIGLAAFGFSINLLTLLALVLCIGLVVDDAIVVLENNQRRADLGEPPIVAAKRGTAQVAFAVIATTAVLVAVFLPVGFMQSNAGRLFRELSVALAGAVVISSFVALTLTPMMCSKLIRPNAKPRGINAWFQARLASVSHVYGRQVGWVVRHTVRWRILGLAIVFGVVAASAALLFVTIPKELTPDEDRGTLFVMVQGPEGAGFDYTVEQIQDVERVMSRYLGEDGPLERVNSRVPGGFGASEEMHTGMAIVFLKDWGERTMDTGEVVDALRRDFQQVPGVRAFAQGRGGGLGGGGGQPLVFVLGGPDYVELAEWRDRCWRRSTKTRTSSVPTPTTRKPVRRSASTSIAPAPPTWGFRCRRWAARWRR
jgi:multidrug efflux pump